ncbi:outer membrane lipoprotein-sorting protein, partial [candidate division WOR-3 bacterium]|nr:outer membrane lipoprotein-sorting protein [candidate division WOR-3 bacterium]
VDSYWTPRQVSMKNLKTEHRTIMELVEVVHDTGLEEGMFSKRMLKRAK